MDILGCDEVQHLQHTIAYYRRRRLHQRRAQRSAIACASTGARRSVFGLP
jgi:hypothetical protein